MSSCAVKAVKKPRSLTRKSSPSPGCSISGFSSFEAGTPIETALGRRPIEEIAIGDLVAARDGFTGEVDLRPVRELFHRTAPSIAQLGELRRRQCRPGVLENAACQRDLQS